MNKLWLFVFVFASSVAFANFESDTSPYSIINGGIDGMIMKNAPPKNSGLDKIGVQKGDIVVDFNYMPILNREAAVTAYNSREPQSVAVIRKDKKVVLEMRK